MQPKPNPNNPTDEPTPISSTQLTNKKTILFDSGRPATTYLIYNGEMIELDEAL
jgi:hypothetical protein